MHFNYSKIMEGNQLIQWFPKIMTAFGFRKPAGNTTLKHAVEQEHAEFREMYKHYFTAANTFCTSNYRCIITDQKDNPCPIP